MPWSTGVRPLISAEFRLRTVHPVFARVKWRLPPVNLTRPAGEGEPAHGPAETRCSDKMGGKCGHPITTGAMVRDGKDGAAPDAPTRPIGPRSPAVLCTSPRKRGMDPAMAVVPRMMKSRRRRASSRSLVPRDTRTRSFV